MTSNQINYAVHLENKRHNQTTENQGQQSINETVRHDRAQEAIGFSQASAAHRQADTAAFNAQTQYLGYKENARHNQRQEDIAKYGHDVNAGKFNVGGMGFNLSGNLYAPTPFSTNTATNVSTASGFYPIVSEGFRKGTEYANFRALYR